MSYTTGTSTMPPHSAGGSRQRRVFVFLMVAVGWLLAPERAHAQEGSADFFFGAPRGWVSIRGGWLFPRAESDLYDFVSDQLTIDPPDFRAGTFNTELGVALAPAIAVEGGLDLNRRSIASEYRHFIGSDGLPIAQHTKLDQTGVFIGVRYTPTQYGQRVSRYAFIPSRVVPYLGGGFSASYYRFEQAGNFVDFITLAVFPDAFQSKGWAFGPYVRGGSDLQVWRRLYVNFDAKYSWERASTLSSDFTGFDGIDLSGFRATTGFSVVC
jgi:hypothetical protein